MWSGERMVGYIDKWIDRRLDGLLNKSLGGFISDGWMDKLIDI